MRSRTLTHGSSSWNSRVTSKMNPMALYVALLAVASAALPVEMQGVDDVPPEFSAEPVAAAVREESFMLRLALNEAGTAWYTVVNAGREPPSAAEVRLGQVEDQIAGGSIYAPQPEALVSADIDGLPAAKSRQLDVFLVAEDTAGNLIPAPRRVPVNLTDFTEPSFPRGYPKISSLGTEYANLELGLDEPGYVYYLLQRAPPGAGPDTTISAASIRECARDVKACPVPNATSAGRIEVGEPIAGSVEPYNGGFLYRSYQMPYRPGNYWLHFAAEDDESVPNLITGRNIVRRKLASVQPPTFSDKGDDPYYWNSLADLSDPVKGYSTYVDPGIKATNPTASIDISDQVVTSHNVDTTRPGEYLVNYSVTYLDTGTGLYVTAFETRVVIVIGPWAPYYKGYSNGINQDEGNNPGSCCEWYRTCHQEDFLFDCTQDTIDACPSSDTSAQCVICNQMDAYVKDGWGYMKYTRTKPDVTGKIGRDSAFIGYVRPDEMERIKAMGNLPGLMGSSKPGYLNAPVHHLEKASGKPQRSDTAAILADDFKWKGRLEDSRYDLLANHNVGRKLLGSSKAVYLNGYLEPSNVRGRNMPTKSKTIKGKTGTVVKFPKFSVCHTVRYQCTAFQDAGSGRCLPIGGNKLAPWEYAKNHGSFTKNEVRSNILQQHLDEKVHHTEPQWQRR